MFDFNPQSLRAHNFAKPEGAVGRQLADIMFERNEPMILKSIQALNLSSKSRLLEIGHGNGRHIMPLMQHYNGLEYTGVEHANTMHRLCSQDTYLQSFNCQFVKVATNSYLLPFSEAQFDRLLAVNVIYFYGRIREALAEYYRVLKANGRIAVAFKDIHTLVSSPIDFTGMILYEPYTIRLLLADAGFGNIKVDSYFEQLPNAYQHASEHCYHIVTAQKILNSKSSFKV